MMSNIIEYDAFRAKIKAIDVACDFVPEVSTTDGYEKSKRVALDVGKVLTALEKKRKELKEDILIRGRAIDGEAKAIKSELESFQGPHKEAYQRLDKEKKERKEKRAAELQGRVDFIAGLPAAMVDADSESVKEAMQDLHSNECLDFYEFTSDALQARKASIDALADMFSRKLQQEADNAELKRLRAEAEAREAASNKAEIEQAAIAQYIAKPPADSSGFDLGQAKTTVPGGDGAVDVSLPAGTSKPESPFVTKAHIAKINVALELMLVQYGLDPVQAAELIDAISAGKVPHLTIEY